MARGPLTTIHVSQKHIKENEKNAMSKPPLTIRTGETEIESYTAEIRGPSRVVYFPDDPLPGGARVWIETYSEVVADPEAEA
jgi:hypothetical protein